MQETGYETFSFYYDALTENVNYPARAAYLDGLVQKYKQSAGKVMLDLACGTGTMTEEMAERGYDMIGVDYSEGMLGQAMEKKIEKQLASYQQELIETHYREVDNMYRQIRGWRHDYRNHIQTMKAYAAAGDWDAIQNYLDLLDTDLQTVDTVIKTGNPMTDAILNSKISLAKAKGIEVVADAHIPVRLKSSEIDLCCILGNLFDNAIEASMKLPEDKRLIRVYMDMKNTQLYISFTNFTAGKKMQKEGGLFRSTKGEGHGFGLVRIDAIVERLDGYISRNSEDGAFTTEILLPQE